MKHRKLDSEIVGIVDACDHPLYTDNVLDRISATKPYGCYQSDMPSRSLLLRRLNKLAGEGRIYKSGTSYLTRWLTTNPKSLDRIRAIEAFRKSDHKRATAAYIALGFGADPNEVIVPSEPSEDNSVCESCGGDGIATGTQRQTTTIIECPECNGYGTSKAQQDYDQARAKREACADNLERNCDEYYVRLTTQQFLSLVSSHETAEGDSE